MSRRVLRRRPSVVKFAQTADAEERKRLAELFVQADANGDGVLQKNELATLLRQLGVHPSKNEFEQIFALLDADGDGRISLPELLSGMQYLRRAPTPRGGDGRMAAYLSGFTAEQGEQLFRLCDADSDGVVSRQDLHAALSREGIKASPQEFNELWRSLDTDSSGSVTLDEFLKAMQWNRAAADASAEQLTAEQQADVLKHFTQGVLSSALDTAERACAAGKWHTAGAFLELVDAELVASIEGFVGEMMTREDKQRHGRMAAEIKAHK